MDFYTEKQQMLDATAQALWLKDLGSVVIIATADIEKNGQPFTHIWSAGYGNAYAQLGSVQDFLQRNKALTNFQVTPPLNIRILPPPPPPEENAF